MITAFSERFPMIGLKNGRLNYIRLMASTPSAAPTIHPHPPFWMPVTGLGMLVIDEAFDCWRDGKDPYDYHVYFDDWWQRDLDSMILRDRNHPSVIMWSIGNELNERDGRSGGAAIVHMLAGYVRSQDPTRPVTAAIHQLAEGVDWSKTDDVFNALDICGYNYEYKRYRPDHERHPKRMIIGSESLVAESFENWTAVMESSFVLGDFVWTSLGYLGEAGIGINCFEGDSRDTSILGKYPCHQANCGDMDLCGFKRPQSYYRDILWQNGTNLYIAVHTPAPEGKKRVVTTWGSPEVQSHWNWQGYENQVLKVDVYSSCEEVELLLNGKSMGRKPSSRQEKHIASFEVTYEPGKLTAIGFTRGKKMTEHEIMTTGAPVTIRLTPDRSIIKAGQNDLCYVTVEVIDRNGMMNPNADHTIFFTVKGAGTLAAVGNGNPMSTEMYRGNQRKAFRGRCLVILKSNGEPGEICLRAQADGLDCAETVIHNESSSST